MEECLDISAHTPLHYLVNRRKFLSVVYRERFIHSGLDTGNMMVYFYCQLFWIWEYLGNMHLGISLGVFLEGLTKKRRIRLNVVAPSHGLKFWT